MSKFSECIDCDVSVINGRKVLLTICYTDIYIDLAMWSELSNFGGSESQVKTKIDNLWNTSVCLIPKAKHKAYQDLL